MNKKEIGEIRRIVTKKHCRIDKITGFFVDEDGTVITKLNDSFLAMQDEEVEKYCDIFKKVLTGHLGKNLYNMEFPLGEESEGGKQNMMWRLLRSAFQEDQLLEGFCKTIVESLNDAGRHLILLAHGAYDIPAKTKDNLDLEDASDYVYLFLIGCVCPVTQVKEGLCYDAAQLRFISRGEDLGVQMPKVGFLYPAFNDRMPDIHSLLYYAKKEDERHPELVDALMGSAVEMPQTGSAQKELFSEVVEDTLGRDCTFDHVRDVTQALDEMIKASQDDPEPLELGRAEVSHILHESGANNKEISQKFDDVFDNTVGDGGSLSAENIGGRSVMQIKSSSLKLSVKTDMSSMLTTKVIDGREYLLIPIQDDLEVNGIRILTARQDEKEDEEEETDDGTEQ